MHAAAAGNGPDDPQAYAVTYIPSADGGKFSMTGVYCALSFDDGNSWASRRPISTDMTVTGRNQTGFDGHNFTMSYNTTEVTCMPGRLCAKRLLYAELAVCYISDCCSPLRSCFGSPMDIWRRL